MEIVSQAEQIFISPFVLGELRAGFLQGSKRDRNERELQLFLHTPRIRVLALDEETSDRYALIRATLTNAGTPVSVNDLWIAASAMQHGLPVLTSDRDFQKIPQILVHHFSVLTMLTVRLSQSRMVPFV